MSKPLPSEFIVVIELDHLKGVHALQQHSLHGRIDLFPLHMGHEENGHLFFFQSLFVCKFLGLKAFGRRNLGITALNVTVRL